WRTHRPADAIASSGACCSVPTSCVAPPRAGRRTRRRPRTTS
ncbi:MAG: hypothetical protein AVDCRST_MAG17-1472, partial [uncultured Solirubrobacterales bacterium]